jgi:hypothetical protein
MLNYTQNAPGGFTPAAGAPPKYDKSRTDNTSLSLSSGAVRGERQGPLRTYGCFVIHIIAKGITMKDSRLFIVFA